MRRDGQIIGNTAAGLRTRAESEKDSASGQRAAANHVAHFAIEQCFPMRNVHSSIDNAVSSGHSLLAVPLLLARQRKIEIRANYNWRHHDGRKEEDR
jgi:hypothetical protein